MCRPTDFSRFAALIFISKSIPRRTPTGSTRFSKRAAKWARRSTRHSLLRDLRSSAIGSARCGRFSIRSSSRGGFGERTASAEARRAVEKPRILAAALYGGEHAILIEILERVGFDVVVNLVDRVTAGNQIAALRRVDAVVARPFRRR